jgi:carbon storage regulator
MLVLSRKPGESLKLGEDVEITVLKVTASGVSLGIKAPRSLAIVRGELAVAVLNENRSAVESAPAAADLEGLSRIFTEQGTEQGTEDVLENTKKAGADDRPGRTEARPKAPKRRH